MSFLTVCSLIIPFKRCITLNWNFNFPRNTLAKVSSSVSTLGIKKKKIGSKAGPLIEKKILPVKTDPEKLVDYCSGLNIYKTGEDSKLGFDYCYPEWLWAVRTGHSPLFKELHPNSMEYWHKVRKIGIQRTNQLTNFKKM